MPKLSVLTNNRSLVLWSAVLAATTATVALVLVGRKRRFALSLPSPGRKGEDSSATAATKVMQFFLDYKTSKEKTRTEVCHVARALCPAYFADQVDEQITVEQIQGGITNLLWKVTNDKNQTCLVRVYGENTEVMIDREKECIVFAELAKRKFGPALWGRFVNGRVEGFYPGRSFDPPQSMGERSPVDFPVLIAEQLARMHNIDDMPVPHESQLWVIIEKFHKLAKGIIFNRDEAKNRQLMNLDLDAFDKEIEWLKSVLPSPLNDHGRTLTGISDKARYLAFRQVFSHNDLLSGNILYIPSENRCQFIDFEYGAYNYAAFDMADHFCEYAGFDFHLEQWYPSEELQKHFWRAYIKALNFKVEPSEEEALLHELYIWTNRFSLATHLFWGFWAAVQAKHSVIDVDFLSYAGRRRDGYFLHKKQFF